MEEQIQELKELMKDVVEEKNTDSFSTFKKNHNTRIIDRKSVV